MYPTKPLGEISKSTSGGTPLRNEKNFWGGKIPWLKSGELNDNLNIQQSEEFITEEGLKKSSAKFFKKGTLLIAMYGATAGKLGILGFDATTNQAICSIQNNKNLFFEKYIFYFLLSIRGKIIKDSFGGAQPNISKTYLENLQIPLPPLSAQQKIVEKLDKIFAKIDKNISLTKQNIANIEEENNAILEKIFTECEEEFGVEKLGEICDIVGGGTPSKNNHEYYGGNILWATVRDMNTTIIKDTEVKITEKGLKESSSNIIPVEGIIIATRVGLGKVCFLEKETAINQDLKGIIPKNNLHRKFLFHFFKKISQYIIDNGIGSTVPGVRLNFIKQIQIPLPPLPKQQEIVTYLDNIFAKNSELKNFYEKNLKNLEELRQSILKQAFEDENFIK